MIPSLIHSIKSDGKNKCIELIETHISWILLTGEFAYKIKKPINLGFLDFSSLEKRRFYCEEEIRLNSRFAPDIYLEVLPITRLNQQIQLNGSGEIIDYAVKMKQFPKNAELDFIVKSHQLKNNHIDQLAEIIAEFHKQIESDQPTGSWGTADQAHQSTLDTFTSLFNNLHDSSEKKDIEKIQQWINANFSEHRKIFQQRHEQSYVRECHGDLHLRNIALINDKIVLFDGIEFSESLRWIDVISEIAFLMMDLQHQNLNAFAYRFLNAYLEHTGDYRGLLLLPYYLVYRTIVRAMVAALRANQDDVNEKQRETLYAEFIAYKKLANDYIHSRKPILFICHGLSGSGKSTITQELLEHLPAIRIRSDVERKRLFGFEKYQKTESSIGKNIYSGNASESTYETMKNLAGDVLDAGYHTIIDATFLSEHQRIAFHKLAREKHSSFVILHFHAPENVLRERIKKRGKNLKEVSEADLKVLDYQLKTCDRLTQAEQDHSFTIDTQQNFNYIDFEKSLLSLLKNNCL